MKNPCFVSKGAPKRRDFCEIRQNGFALVVSLSLMTLLVILAISLLTLSTKALSTSTRESDLAEAKSNARVALAMAIAQLQKQTGPDQRVTVSADQLSSGGNGEESSAGEGRRHWTGVYRSWASGSRTRPEPQFMKWLVSGDDNDLSQVSTAESAAGGTETVDLVGEGTVGSKEEGFVKAPSIRVDSMAGGAARLAWWTGDQGVKAAMATPKVEEDASFAEVRGGLQGAQRNSVEFAGSSGGKPFGKLDPEDSRISLVTGWKQSAFLANDVESPKPLFHDIAPFSSGLLTNVRAGGFRKDLSMQLERASAVATSTLASSRTAFYNVAGENGINLHELWCYYNLYKDLRTTGGATYTTGGRIPSGAPFLQVEGSAAACQNDDEFFFKQPVIISYQLVISLETRPTTVNGSTVNRLHVVADPILTFWNPLDVPVVVPRTSYFSVKYWQVPYDLFISVNGGPQARYPLAAALTGAAANANGDGNYLSLVAGSEQQLVFKPGEVIKVSQSASTQVKTGADHKLIGRTGFNYAGGVSLAMKNAAGGYIDLPSNSRITYEARPNNLTAGKTNSSGNTVNGAVAHTRHFSLTHHEYYIGDDRGSNSLGIGGMCLDWDFGNRRVKPSETRGETQPGTKASSQRYYADLKTDVFKTLRGNDTRQLGASEISLRKAPIMLLSYNAKTEMGSDLGTRYLSRFNPKALHVDFYDLSPRERDILPYEFTVEPLLSWRNRSLETSTNGNAYYGGSMNAEFGSSFVTTHSVPREPLVSLAAFQHSFANGFEMQKPKYGYATLNAREPLLPQVGHAIGNSMAPPMIAKDKTDGSLAGGRPIADHSYLANQALWDDWFLSGIAPQTSASFSNRRQQRVVAQEFFSGSGTLPVTRYLPDTDGLDADQLVSDFFSGSTPRDAATQAIGSLIRVDGMFNVNSTSVEAWKAVLGSLKERQVIVRDSSGGESLVQSEDVPVANLMSPQRDVISASGGLNVQEPTQWVGRRTLTEDEIDELARALVKEVRKRGPFLCLGDFINRRVGNDAELARAGAIQSALDSDDVKINRAFLSGARAVAGGVSSRFAFPDAESGPAGYGSPGVVKQGDILTPIAPLLSARSDSFVIRAYGEAVNKDGEVLARAWCEATVERDNQFVDESDKPETLLASLTSNANKAFGRRYQMTSFRWLHPDEV